MAALLDDEIADEIRKVDIKDYSAISDLFGRFDGVDIGDKNSLEVLTDWGVVVKGHHPL